jgi:hypothetical protein
MKNLLITLSVLFCTQSYASHIIDSLRAGINNNKDTLQVALLDELSWQYGPLNSDSAIYFGEQALALAQQLGFEKGEAQRIGRGLLLQWQLEQGNFLFYKSIGTQT